MGLINMMPRYRDNIDDMRIMRAKTSDETAEIERQLEFKDKCLDAQAKSEVLKDYRWAKRNKYGFWVGISKKDKKVEYHSTYDSHLADLHDSAVRSRVYGLAYHIRSIDNLNLFLDSSFAYYDENELDKVFISLIDEMDYEFKKDFYDYYKNRVMFYKYKQEVLKNLRSVLYSANWHLEREKRKILKIEFKYSTGFTWWTDD